MTESLSVCFRINPRYPGQKHYVIHDPEKRWPKIKIFTFYDGYGYVNFHDTRGVKIHHPFNLCGPTTDLDLWHSLCLALDSQPERYSQGLGTTPSPYIFLHFQFDDNAQIATQDALKSKYCTVQ